MCIEPITFRAPANDKRHIITVATQQSRSPTVTERLHHGQPLPIPFSSLLQVGKVLGSTNELLPSSNRLIKNLLKIVSLVPK